MSLNPLILLVLVYFTAIFFGGAHVWAQAVLILSIFGLLLAGLWSWLLRKNQPASPLTKIILDPPSLVGILFLAWVTFQLVPLSPKVAAFLSPNTQAIWEKTLLFGGNSPFPLSFYPYITLNSLIFGAALVFFYWLALYGIKRRNQVHGLIFGLLLLGTMMSIYALVQVATGQEYVLWWKNTVRQKVATGTFINPNHLAGFLSMLICLGIGYVWVLGQEEWRPFAGKASWYMRIERWASFIGNWRIILLLSVALMMAALLTTASRGGVLSLLAGLIFMVGLILARFFKKRHAYVLILMLSVACMYVTYMGMDRVMARFKYFTQGLQNRLAIAEATYKMGKDFPYTGTGMGTFEFVFPKYQDYKVNILFDYAHNDWVQLFAETGGVGFLIIAAGFIWFMGSSIGRWRRRRDPFAVGIGLGGMGALVSIAVHSLSDFNLHLPANAILLSLILVLLYLALHSEAHDGQEHFSYHKGSFKFPLWMKVLIVGITTLGVGAMAKQVIQVWQADSLARTVWDSTAPFLPPSDQDLKKAWTLAPGNAIYWAWMARRLPEHPGNLPQVHGARQNTPQDLDIYLLAEGIRRNPTSWAIWRDLGWAAFFKMGKDSNYLPLAQKAFDQARRLRPYAPQGHLELGIIELAAYARKLKGNEGDSWKQAFGRALSLDPSLLPMVLDQMIFYLGQEGLKEVREVLPGDASGYLRAADYLLKQGFHESGLKILAEGEEKRGQDVGKLWAAFQQGGKGAVEERNELLERILSLDPQHPESLTARGMVLEALKSQEQRGGPLRELGNLREIAWALQKIDREKKGSPADIYYFLGRVAEEEGNFGEAKLHFQKSLNLNPQYFPAWVHLRDILARKSWSVTEQVELENLERKIKLFDMDRVVGDAWRWGWAYEGCTSWVAPFRIGQVRKRMEIKFSGDHQRAWKLLLDGRFVAAWAGSSWHETKTFSLPAGEHVFRLVQYRGPTLLDQRILPFNLEIRME